MQLWLNPEFVRHRRAELRPTRVVIAAGVVAVVAALIAFSSWAENPENSQEAFRVFFLWVMGLQFVLVGIWCAFACGQAISQERLLKTYDFLRTTALSPGELMVGKLFGSPILGYFVVGCSLLLSVPAGVLAGIGPGTILETYILLVVFALFTSVIALWISMLNEKSSTGAAVILILGLIGSFSVLSESPFPALGGLSVVPAIIALYSPQPASSPVIFHYPVSFFLNTLVMQGIFSAWFILMLLRNLKKDRTEIRLLSRREAIGLAAFLNLLFYALIKSDPPLEADFMTGMFSLLNAAVVLVVGLSTLSSREKLKVWWRQYRDGEQSYFSESGLVWPWMIASGAVGYGMHLAASPFIRASIGADYSLGKAALQLSIFLVFTIRDVLFLQFCTLTRMKRPLGAGALYLILYYTVAAVLGGTFPEGSSLHWWILNVATFSGATFPTPDHASIYAGILAQTALILVLLSFIHARLNRLAAFSVAVKA